MSDLIVRTSTGSVSETIERLLAALEQRSITVFARIDHAEGARSVGLALPDETVLVFGSPRAGTPLMQADATVGIELPLKILVWDDDGTTTLGYHDPTELAAAYELGSAAGVLEQMQRLLAALVAEAAHEGG
jgi:uncharacterized protein (DUF302 family)